jgi:hypothetical protein
MSVTVSPNCRQYKKDGKVVATGRIVVAADGKIRTVNVSATDSAGKKVKSTAVFRDLLFHRGGETAKAETASKMRGNSRGHDEDCPVIPDIDVCRCSRRGRQCQR